MNVGVPTSMREWLNMTVKTAYIGQGYAAYTAHLSVAIVMRAFVQFDEDVTSVAFDNRGSNLFDFWTGENVEKVLNDEKLQRHIYAYQKNGEFTCRFVPIYNTKGQYVEFIPVDNLSYLEDWAKTI